MAEKKTTTKKSTKVEEKKDSKPEGYSDRLCPKYGDKKLKVRGRTFEGDVVKKLPGRVTIQFERMIKLPKYERYEKRRTKIHARLPEYMQDDIAVGDRIQIGETRPISKTIHFVVTKVIRKSEAKE